MFRPSGAWLKYWVGGYKHFVPTGQEVSQSKSSVRTTDY
jgi:hypothetical protein